MVNQVSTEPDEECVRINVNVDDPAAVTAGRDGLEGDRPAGIRDPVSAQESLDGRIFNRFVGINAGGVSVPSSEYHSR